MCVDVPTWRKFSATLSPVGIGLIGSGTGDMNRTKFAALVLILAGTAALAYGTFSHSSESQVSQTDSRQMQTVEPQPASIPAWIGGGVLAIGLVLLASTIKS
jgi:hypothetical protein